MLTLKFGGTSMGSARRILDSTDIMIGRAETDRISVVVSAVAGVSNKLQAAIDGCVAGGVAASYVSELRSIHQDICAEIKSTLSAFDSQPVLAKIEEHLVELDKLLTGISSFGECPSGVHCRIMGMGELMCAPIVEAVLLAKKQSVILLDSRKFIYTTGDQKEGDPDYSHCADAFADYRDGSAPMAQILLFPGFICSWISGTGAKPVMGLLGRNGSDFSAAIVGSCLGSSKVEFWTDVDGIYTADPRIIKDAVLVKDMSYEEAMELSFFGSKVLHPKTLAPLAAKNIEAWSLNSHNPASRGTRIARGPFVDEKSGPVRGISCLKDCAMISVTGAGMKGRKGMASRIFSVVGNAGISVLLITQSSSEYTVSFCVRKAYAQKVQDILKAEFALEISTKLLNPIEVYDDLAIVSIIGDAMKQKRGVAGTFFDSLASRDINIKAIAQGSSERSISAVIKAEDGDMAVRVVHQFFFNTVQSIQVYAFGAGTIGGTMLDQINEQHDILLEQGIDVRVMAIANIDGMIFNADGIELNGWRDKVKADGKKTNLDEILEFVKETKPLNPIFVDCTASYDLPERYIDILKTGMNIATPNKRANSMSMDFYHKLRETANEMHVRFLYETNVGAGLPIIDTLQNLFKSGDKLTGFNGIMSGSLSYIFGKLDEGKKFSEAVLEAKELRYTEPDPRDDLKGTDVARKALIIARESGMEIELEDIEMRSIFPEGFSLEGTTEEFLKKLPELDSYFADKMAALKKENKVLRMGASIKDGKVSVGMLEVGPEDPLYGVRGGENAFVFHTARYTPIPLTVRGYGAGAGVTAAGVFGDILRTVSWNVSKF
ncbi:bifunctional aspartate kinase/homoserine dehydrogenase I [Treponema sp.]|uniref:bifunctional aspartate kinase/homoserine dehydrogenase I n=1 Tax=Treponema sp. TaxID=166 RepID=UPI0025F9E4AC|nr:bifunctional aspartate kinase/homoserine dehydrogenase I [Treponema sp.]MCR5218907.1 bifunctional aspartate kinase/homoserine dehydrogenase I [Treponema sp.]